MINICAPPLAVKPIFEITALRYVRHWNRGIKDRCGSERLSIENDLLCLLEDWSLYWKNTEQKKAQVDGQSTWVDDIR